MIHRLDLGVGEVVQALKDTDMLKNSIVIFFSDNGGPTLGIHSTASSNYPLRGQKNAGWEGGIRTNAIIYAPFLPKGIVKNEIFHISDFLPTLRTLSNANFEISSNIDGIDQSRVIKSFMPLPFKFHPRKEVIFIDNIYHYSSIILDGYKLVNGSWKDGLYDGWLGVNNNLDNKSKIYEKNVRKSKVWKAINSSKNSFTIQKVKFYSKVDCKGVKNPKPCDLLKAPCFYDVINDPCELNDLSKELPGLFKHFLNRLDFIEKNVVPSRRKPSDPRCDPKNFNYTWHWWQDDSE